MPNRERALSERHGDVLAHGETGDEALLLAVLGDEPDAGEDGAARRIARRHQPVLDPDLALIDVEVAEDGAGELGAAGADEAGDADDLAAADREGDVAEQAALAEMADLEDRRAGFRRCARGRPRRGCDRPSWR